MGVFEVVPRKDNDREVRIGGRLQTTRGWSERRSGAQTVEDLCELVRPSLPVEVTSHNVQPVCDELAGQLEIIEEPPDRGRHTLRVARGHNECGLLVCRVFAASAVVGRHKRDAARERLQPGLGEAFEPAPNHENATRVVLASERDLVEVLVCISLHRDV